LLHLYLLLAQLKPWYVLPQHHLATLARIRLDVAQSQIGAKDGRFLASVRSLDESKPVFVPRYSFPMNSRETLKEQILTKAVVHGKVILSSGKEADYYVDLRRVTLDSVAAPLVGQVMLDLTADLDYEAVGGLTLGADPVATAMMHVAAQQGKKIDSFVVRKAEKAHGLQRRIEGPDVKGKRVLAVEDTSTTGGSVLTAAEALVEAGAIVVGVAVIVERGAEPKIKEAGYEYRAAYQLSDLGL
jgi:orotate phosphoribosyltransferase